MMYQEIEAPQERGLPQLPGYRNYYLIGEGGYGLIYEAIQTSTGQRVAIKMLKLDQDLDATRRKYQIARFERETELCAELNHPHIVALLDKGFSASGIPYAVFEFIEGETLKDLIVGQGGISAELTGELMAQVLDALAAAHAKGIVHRDLKPHNIMVLQTGSQMHIKVLDFGIGAFTLEFRGNDYLSLTLTREVLGTPAYSAPEQLRGEPATIKSDLYAWGLVLIECLTGVPVIKAESVAEVFQQQLNTENIPLPPALAGHSLAELLRRVLKKNVRLRTGDAKALYQDFRKINFSTLVGQIERYPSPLTEKGPDSPTAANQLIWQDRLSEKRQITILCIKLSLSLQEASNLELEALDAIQKDQINQVKDTAVRFGGHIAASVTDHVVVYFGYPKVTDTDARRAGRVALEVLGEVKKRSTILEAQYGLRLSTRLSLHSGTTLTRPNQLPEGIVPNTAFDLLYLTKPGSILVSQDAKRLLDPYLEFEALERSKLPEIPFHLTTWNIVGERQTEALSFLRPWSANRNMVGRNLERNQVIDHWQSAKQGHGKALVLNGQAGIGKSKMVYEIKKQVRADGFSFREIRCFPEHKNNALFPFLELLRNQWGINDSPDTAQSISILENELGAIGAELTTSLPILCSWLSIPLPAPYQQSEASPDAQKRILFDLLRKSLAHLALNRPMMLVLEDLHWLDPTGREFVEYLLQDWDQQSCLLLMTTRPAFNPPWEFEHLSQLHLTPLTDAATNILVEGVLDGNQIAAQALQYITERTDGIPLYIEELSRMLVEEGYLVLQEEGYQFDEKTDIQAIPATLQDLLNARLDRLGLAKESAQIAATIGREFSYELLVRASLRDEASIQADLEALTDADLIFRQRRVQDEVYIFRHALIRDAAYDGMLKPARVDHHARIAHTLRTEFPDLLEENPFEVARHHAGAEEFQEGSELGIKAIEKQVGNSANAEAISLSETLRGWISHLDNPQLIQERKLLLNSTVIPAYMAKNGYADGKVFELNKENGQYMEALRAAGVDLGHLEDEAFRVTYDEFTYHHNMAERRKAAELREIMLENLKANPNRKRQMGAYGFIGQSLHLDGKTNESLKIHQWIIDNYDAEEDGELYSEYGIDPKVCALMDFFQIGVGRWGPVSSNKYSLECHTHAKKTQHDISIAVSYLFRALHFSYNEQPEKVLQIGQAYKEEFAHRGDKLWVNQHLQMCLHCAEASTEYPESYISTMISSGQKAYLSYFEPLLAKVYLQLAKPKKAMALMESSIQRCKEQGEYWTMPYLHLTYAKALLAKGGIFTDQIDQILKFGHDESERMSMNWWGLQIALFGAKNAPKKFHKKSLSRLSRAMEKVNEGHDTETYIQAESISHPKHQ